MASQFPLNSSLILPTFVFPSPLTTAWATSQGQNYNPKGQQSIFSQMLLTLPKGSRISAATSLHVISLTGLMGLQSSGKGFTSITSNPLSPYSTRKESSRSMGLEFRTLASRELETSNRISNVNYTSIKKKELQSNSFWDSSMWFVYPLAPSIGLHRDLCQISLRVQASQLWKIWCPRSFLSLISHGLPSLPTSPFSKGIIREYSVVQSTSSSRTTAIFAACPNCSQQSLLESRKETFNAIK